MFDRFQHYLSYGSTDQQTVRELSDCFDGLLVPGTIAAFQSEGTKGFVLSLSARSSDPYVIDPRFPLFQNRLSAPKKSHLMLAELLGAPQLINRLRAPQPIDYSAELVATIARNWIDFNVGFEDVKSKTFDKYASRLNEQVLPENKQEPAFILPPYMMIEDLSDGWREVSDRIWAASVAYAEEKSVRGKLRKVIAAASASIWGEIARTETEQELVAWISDLDEFRPGSEPELLAYGNALKGVSARGQRVFALYGGFFSVLLARYGLVGSSHGIGFGEHRDWVELPSSGAPLPRYYVPRLHRYIGIDIAVALWRQFPELIACSCDECHGESPASLDYHGLMKHSVRARALEIDAWGSIPTDEAVDRLNADFSAFRAAAEQLDAPAAIRKRAGEIYLHLAMWSRILQRLG